MPYGGVVLDFSKRADFRAPPGISSPYGSPLGATTFGGGRGGGRRWFQGQDDWLLETNPALRRPQLYRSLKIMRERLPIIATYTAIFQSYCAKAKYSFKPQEDGDNASAETAERLLYGDMQANWPQLLIKMAAYRLMGFSVVEWIAEQGDDGLWRLTDAWHIPQWSVTSMELDRRERVTHFNQQGIGIAQEARIPRAKCFYLSEQANVDSPYGRGVLADCAEVGLQLLQLQELEHRGNLSNLRRKPNVLAPLADLNKQLADGAIKKEDYNRMVGELQAFIQNPDSGPDIDILWESQTYPALREGGAVESPSNQRVWDLVYPQPVPTDLSGQSPMERKTTEIARLLGIEALLLGTTSDTGSFALAEVQAGLFHQAIDSVLRDIADEKQRVLRILWTVNEGRLHPEAERHQQEKEQADLEAENAKAERLKAINGGGEGGKDKQSDPLSKAIDDVNARKSKPERPRGEPAEPGDYASMAPDVQADLSTYISAGDLIEIVQNVAGLGLTVNPDSNMVRDILDRAGLDADGAFQGLEDAHLDRMEEMEARGIEEGPPNGEGKSPPFGKRRGR